MGENASGSNQIRLDGLRKSNLTHPPNSEQLPNITSQPRTKVHGDAQRAAKIGYETGCNWTQTSFSGPGRTLEFF